MHSSRLVRYLIYCLLAIGIIWGVNEVLSFYYWYKGNESWAELMRGQKEDLKDYKNDSIFHGKINSFIKLKKYNQAIHELNERIKSTTTNKDFLIVDRGDIYRYKGDIDSAYISYSEAISLDSNNVNAYVKRGEIEFTQNGLDDAIGDFKVAANNNFDYYYFLGILQQKRAI